MGNIMMYQVASKLDACAKLATRISPQVPFRKGKSVSELVTKVDNDQTQVDKTGVSESVS